jgi:hypothetical protein
MRVLRCLRPTLLLLGGGLLGVGVMGEAPGTALAQDTEEATADTTRVAEPPCSEPSPCPAPDSTKTPEVTCYEPRSASVSEPLALGT